MIKFLLKRPIAVTMTFIAIVMLGLVAYQMLPIALMPDIPIPEITVQVSYPNTTARELEDAVIKPLRNQLIQVAYLDDISSETRDGFSQIRMIFNYGTNIDYAFIEVNEKIDGAMNHLPREISRPTVIKASATDLPVFYLNVSQKKSGEGEESMIDLSRFCNSVIRKRIEQLPQVAMADISGVVNPEILLSPKTNLWQSLGITFSDIENCITNSNIRQGNILVREGHRQYHIRLSNGIVNKEDLANIVLRKNGKIYQLKELVDIQVVPQKLRGMFITGDKQAITLSIIQQSDARVAELKEELQFLTQEFIKDYPHLNFEVARDQTRLLDYSIQNLKQNLVLGAVLAFLVLFFFLSDTKSPVLIAISIPVSLIICFLFFKLFSLSINIISLSGLALGIGMIIDNSIIVIDNIKQHRDRGKELMVACIDGTNEIIRPILSSTLTTCAVFIPLIFLSGIAGALFYDEAISVSVGLISSFIVAITILPVYYFVLFKQGKKKSSKKRFEKLMGHLSISSRFENFYERGMNIVFNNKSVFIVLFLLILGLTYVLFRIIDKERLPSLEQNELLVHIDWNQNIHPEENKKRITETIHLLEDKTIIANAFLGEQQFVLNRDRQLDLFQSEIYFEFKSGTDLKHIRDSLNGYFNKNYPLAKVEFLKPKNIFEKIFAKDEAPLIAKILTIENSETELLQELVQQCDNTLKTAYKNNLITEEHIEIAIDFEKALLYDVPYQAIVTALKTIFSENQVITLHSYNQYLPVVLGEDEVIIQDIIANRFVKNKNGAEIALRPLIKINYAEDRKFLYAGREGEYFSLNYYPKQNEIETYQSIIKSKASALGFKDIYFSGSISSNKKMLGELTIVLLVAILLLYFIMAAQFESVIQPLIVLLEIPIDIAGTLLLLLIFGQSLNIMSAIGIIVMSGIIINDSILKVDTINRLRRTGLPIKEAIFKGGRMRLRSIVMTSLTTILAVTPFLLTNDLGSELQKPLALALIGGLFIGTLVSLYFIPLAYWAIYRNNENIYNK